MKSPLPLSLLLPIVAMMAVIGVSNVAVQHAINDWLTWGAFTYPLAFLVTDLTNRAHGPGRARTVAYVGFPFGMGLSIILAVAADIPLWEGVRVALASGFAFHLRAAIRHRAVPPAAARPLVAGAAGLVALGLRFGYRDLLQRGLRAHGPAVGDLGARRLCDQGRDGSGPAHPLPAADARYRAFPLQRPETSGEPIGP